MNLHELPFNNNTDDDSFYKAITHFFNDYNADFLNRNNQNFSPFELDEDLRHNMLSEVDPDLNFFETNQRLLNANTTSNYYNEETLNKELLNCHHQDCLSIMHHNIRSLPKHDDQLTSYLRCLTVEFNIIGLSETWLSNENAGVYGIDNYQHIYNCRQTRRGGGVSLYIKNGIEFSVLDNLNRSTDIYECLFIEIKKSEFNTNHDIIIGVIYSPPNRNVQQFNECLLEILNDIKSNNKLCFLMGDFNINLLHQDTHAPTSEFLEILYSSSYFPLITKPTRISSSSATLIDNIYCNKILDNDYFNGILVTDISDHFPIFTMLKKYNLDKSRKVYKNRSLSQKNCTLFSNKLMHTNWNPILESNNCSDAFTKFIDCFKSVYYECFPIRRSKNNYSNKLPWLTLGLKESIGRKNKLFVMYKKEPSQENLNTYKQYKCRLNRLLRNAKREYFQKLIEQNRNNMKKSWQIMKELLQRTNVSHNPSRLNINGQIITDSKEIAEKFNAFFINIGKNLSKDLPTSNIDPISYLKEINVTECIFMNPVDKKEIEKIILNMKNSSPGLDEIHTSIVKQTFHHYLSVLVHIINLSLSQGVFPLELKKAKVIPLFKSGNSDIVNNYRPISILPCFSKVFERVIYDRLMKFIEEKHLLFENQFGFRQNHGTTLALITLVNKIVTGMNKNEKTLGTFLDFRKAFDTVNHHILLAKLYKYGIRGTCYDLVKDYLNDRVQYVQIGECMSESGAITCGVPQGSILGPLLFLLYINDIYSVSKKLFIVLFADDSNIFIQGKDTTEMIDILNVELDKIYKWLLSNRLSLNIEKTYLMLFVRNRSSEKLNKDIKIAGKMITRVESTKFLGIVIDSKLSWEPHLKFIRKKIAKGLGIICKAKKYLLKHTLRSLYFSFIYPYISYGIEAWGSAAACHTLPIFKLQKKIIRLITLSHFRAHTLPLFHHLNILTFYEIYIQQLCLLMFKINNLQCPATISNMYQKNYEYHSHSTRSSYKFRLPLYHYSSLHKSFLYKSIVIWNYVITKIDHHCSVHSFKHRLKIYLRNHSENVLNIYNL